MQGAATDAVGRDPATLDAATHLGALHDTDQGQMPRVPVQLDALSKPSKLTVKAPAHSPLNAVQINAEIATQIFVSVTDRAWLALMYCVYCVHHRLFMDNRNHAGQSMLGICWRGIASSSRPEQHKNHHLWPASSRWHPLCKPVQPHLTANQQAACQAPSRTDSLVTT